MPIDAQNETVIQPIDIMMVTNGAKNEASITFMGENASSKAARIGAILIYHPDMTKQLGDAKGFAEARTKQLIEACLAYLNS